ncbi:MAG: hypothetical protein ABSA97_09525 [Verrucomicrobiia bacterium]
MATGNRHRSSVGSAKLARNLHQLVANLHAARAWVESLRPTVSTTDQCVVTKTARCGAGAFGGVEDDPV